MAVPSPKSTVILVVEPRPFTRKTIYCHSHCQFPGWCTSEDIFHNIFRNEVKWQIMELNIYPTCWCFSHCATYTCCPVPCNTHCCWLVLSEVSTSSKKTKKVTFFPRVATSVPSLVKSWRPLGALLGHLWRLGLYFSRVPSVQLLDKALRYLEFVKDKEEHYTSE